MSFNVEDEIAMLNYKEVQKTKLARQEAELEQLPKAINVTYIGDLQSGYSHKGRSRQRSNDPYRFYKDIPITITDPADVKYFYLRANKEIFKVELVEAGVSKPKVEVQSEPVLDAELEKQKAKAEEIAKKEEAKKEEVKEEVETVDTGEALEETGLSLKIRNRIVEAGFNSLEKIANAKLEDLMEVDGVGQVTAERIQAQAQAKLKK